MIYNTIIEKLKEGYGIGKQTYTNGTVIYSVTKVEGDGSRITCYEIAYNIAKKLMKEEGAIMVHEKENINAINFIPTPVKPNCVRYYTND